MLGSMMGLSGAVGGFSSLVGMVTNFNNSNSNIYQALEGGTDNESITALLDQLGIEQPAGFDMSEMRQVQADYSELQQYYTQKNDIEFQKSENKLEDKKGEYFTNHHYEFPMKDGAPDLSATPTVVDGPETPAQAAQRASYERNVEAQIKEQNLEASRNATPDPNSATGKLQALADDPKAYSEMLNSPEGSEKYNQLMEAAQKEQDMATIAEREQILLATTPPELRGEVKQVTSEKIAVYESNYNALKNSPEGQKLAECQNSLNEYLAQVRASLAGTRDSSEAIYSPDMMHTMYANNSL